MIPGLGRTLGEGNSYPLQSSGVENSLDGISTPGVRGPVGVAGCRCDRGGWLGARLGRDPRWPGARAGQGQRIFPGPPRVQTQVSCITGAWAQSWSSAALAARSVLPSNRPATPLFSPACWEPGFQARVPTQPRTQPTASVTAAARHPDRAPDPRGTGHAPVRVECKT